MLTLNLTSIGVALQDVIDKATLFSACSGVPDLFSGLSAETLYSVGLVPGDLVLEEIGHAQRIAIQEQIGIITLAGTCKYVIISDATEILLIVATNDIVCALSDEITFPLSAYSIIAENL